LPDSRLGIRTAPLLLLGRPDVKADVGLDGRLAAEAERAAAELSARAAALRDQADADVIAGRRAIDEAQQRWLETQLSDAQRSRLLQVDLQWEGPSALTSRPMVADALGLTARQRQRLAQAVAERDRRRLQGMPLAQRERLLAEEALRVLTDPQKDRWKAMLGRPFVPRLATLPREGAPR
jgi:hypothetical protein